MRTQLYAARYFDQPEKDTDFATDTGESVLRVHQDGRHNELRFRFRSELDPITRYLWKCVQQVIVLGELSRKESAYSAEVALSPYLAGGKVLQPSALRKPLEAFIQAKQDPEELKNAFEALSWVTTPEEWLGFLSQEVQTKQTRAALLLRTLVSHPLTGNIPKEHVEIQLPFEEQAAAELKDSVDRQAVLDGVRLARWSVLKRPR